MPAILQSARKNLNIYYSRRQVAAAPTATLVQAVRPAVLPLFRIYCVVTRTKSHLVGHVKEIITTYFKLLSPADAAEQFYTLLLYSDFA